MGGHERMVATCQKHKLPTSLKKINAVNCWGELAIVSYSLCHKYHTARIYYGYSFEVAIL